MSLIDDMMGLNQASQILNMLEPKEKAPAHNTEANQEEGKDGTMRPEKPLPLAMKVEY